MWRIAVVLVAACLCLSSLGCGSSTIQARGRILKKGEPFEPGPGEALRIILAPLDPPAGETYDSFAAEYQGDGTFVVKGKDGKGLPPGKYRVTLQLLKKKKDLFKGKLSGPKSPFTCEITDGSDEIIVDLDRMPRRR
jgi:hypothetical protein